MKFTKQQQLAIDSEGKNIIVSAGAGSGKTAVLTARVIRKLKDGVDVDKLLVLTFTNEAASEMKNRIRDAIISNNLTEQLALLDSAYITTFDSFALSLVKKYHYLLNIPKDVGIIDGGQIKIYKYKLIDRIFDNQYGSLEFDRMIDDYCLKDDKIIKNFIYNIIDNFSLLIDCDDYINNYLDNFYKKEYINELISEYEGIIRNKVLELGTLYNQLVNYASDSLISKLDSYLEPLFKAQNYQEYRLFLVNSTPQFRGISEEGIYLKDEVKDRIKEIINLLKYDSYQDIIDSYLKTKDNVRVILNIIKLVNQELLKYKESKNTYEFNDISHMAIKIVKEHLDIRHEIKNYFNEIMIDEYQDTSTLQEEFIKYISNNNVYMVGDIKQSIYRFRNANPYIFKDKYDNYSGTNEGLKIDLVENFRSREEVLHNINTIFNLVMDDILGSADYLTSHNMVFGNDLYITENGGYNYNMEIYNYEYSKEDIYSKEEKELFIVSKDIQEKIKSKYQIFDKKTNKLRDIKYSDICIITDRNKYLALYRKILEFNEIPSLIYMNEKLGNDQVFLVIKNLIALVYYVNNKIYDDKFKYAFTSVARSFLFEYSDDTIYQIHKNKSFYNNEIFKKCLVIDMNVPIFDMLEQILSVFNVYEKLTLLSSIYQNIIEVDSIINIATNVSKEGLSISEFIDYLNDTVNMNIPIEYKINQTGENAVKIMNIHKSKGLEFGLCYYVGLHNEFRFSDISSKFLVNNKYGIILPEIKDGLLDDSFVKTLYANNYYLEEVSEKIRLFYVALTRAREKMIIVTSINEDVNCYNNLVPEYIRIKYRSFLDILNSLSPIREYIVKKEAVVNGEYRKIKIKDINMDSNMIINNYTLNIDGTIVDNKHYAKRPLLIDQEMAEKMEYGTKIHEMFEYANFFDSDNGYVSKFLTKIPKNYVKLYREFEFIDNENNTNYHGIIDLMVEYDKIIYIVDYKLKDISDIEYKEQLSGYKKYISKITDKEIKTFLYSVNDNELVEVCDE